MNPPGLQRLGTWLENRPAAQSDPLDQTVATRTVWLDGADVLVEGQVAVSAVPSERDVVEGAYTTEHLAVWTVQPPVVGQADHHAKR